MSDITTEMEFDSEEFFEEKGVSVSESFDGSGNTKIYNKNHKG